MTDHQSSPDIVQRLRNFCVWNNRQSHYEPVPLTQEAATEIEQLRAARCSAGIAGLDIPPERHRADEQRKDIQHAWDIVGMVTDGHLLNSTEGHLAVLRGIQMGRRLSGDLAEPWECMGRKQSLPEPGECNWPDCGCDPHATKVIESLLEQGWGPRDPAQPSAGIETLRKEYAELWRLQIIGAGGDERIAIQAVTLAALNGLFNHLGVAQPSAEPIAWIVQWRTPHTPKTVSAYVKEDDARRAAENVARYSDSSGVVVTPAYAMIEIKQCR